MKIVVDDLRGPEIAALLEAHLDLMRSQSPPESVHALDLESLRVPEITFWTAWDDGELMGCGALKQLPQDGEGEIKSMHVRKDHRGGGLADQVLQHLLSVAREDALERVSLETGSQDVFFPARNFYARHGFSTCPPFEGYAPDPNSVFMTLRL